MRDLLSPSHRENVIAEDLQAFIDDVEGERVEELDLLVAISDQFCPKRKPDLLAGENKNHLFLLQMKCRRRHLH